MKKIILLLIGTVVFVVGWEIWQYNVYSCTNIAAENWKSHRLIECSIYYDEKGVTNNEDEIDVNGLIKMSQANVATFVELDTFYSKDKRSVYYKDKKITGAEPRSFVLFGGEYFKDSRYVYWHGERYPVIDINSFELFSSDTRYARDITHEYFNGGVIQEVGEATSSRILVSPFNGDEITRDKDKEIFWRQSEINYIDKIAIALVGDDGSFVWLVDEKAPNTGSFVWSPYTATTSLDVSYQLVFYGHYKDGVDKINIPNKFFVVEEGKPGVSLKINFSDEKTVRVFSGDNVYISWAASNVERCYLINGIQQPLVGHATTRFFQVGGARTTEHMYYIECVTDKGLYIEDSVTIETVLPSSELNN